MRSQQIQDDLLELNSIAGQLREIVRQFSPKDDTMPLEVVRRQGENLSHAYVHIQGLDRGLSVAKQRPQSRDHIGGAVATPDRAARTRCPCDLPWR
jgi:hypothetical protein